MKLSKNANLVYTARKIKNPPHKIANITPKIKLKLGKEKQNTTGNFFLDKKN